MSQWKNTADAANSVSYVASSLHQGSGNANEASNNTSLVANVTPASIVDAGVGQTIAVGQFPVTSYAKANTTSSESNLVHGTGWALRRAYEGPVLTMAAANGSGFANGETAVLSNGQVNAVATLLANSTGNLVSATISSTGLFPNGSSGLATGGVFVNSSVVAATFTREKHVTQVSFTGTNATFEASASVISVTGSNLLYGLTSTGNATTNATGGFTGAVATFGNTPGLFGAAQVAANCTVVVTLASNGQVIGGLTPTVTLGTSTGGVINGFTMGGRAGRVTYEILAAMAPYSLANGALANSTNGGLAQLPQ